jgi:uncharacterized DUF497 family protein
MWIEDFEIDDQNAEHFARHGIRFDQVYEVLDDDHHYFGRNPRSDLHVATHIVIGYDYGGACLTIPAFETATPGLWRPVTACYSTPAEETRRLRHRRRS